VDGQKIAPPVTEPSSARILTISMAVRVLPDPCTRARSKLSFFKAASIALF